MPRKRNYQKRIPSLLELLEDGALCGCGRQATHWHNAPKGPRCDFCAKCETKEFNRAIHNDVEVKPAKNGDHRKRIKDKSERDRPISDPMPVLISFENQNEQM